MSLYLGRPLKFCPFHKIAFADNRGRLPITAFLELTLVRGNVPITPLGILSLGTVFFSAPNAKAGKQDPAFLMKFGT